MTLKNQLTTTLLLHFILLAGLHFIGLSYLQNKTEQQYSYDAKAALNEYRAILLHSQYKKGASESLTNDSSQSRVMPQSDHLDDIASNIEMIIHNNNAAVYQRFTIASFTLAIIVSVLSHQIIVNKTKSITEKVQQLSSIGENLHTPCTAPKKCCKEVHEMASAITKTKTFISQALELSIDNIEDRTERPSCSNLNPRNQVALKNTFLTSLSHEIKMPLNAITGYTSSLKNDINDPRLLNQIDKIDRNGTMVLDLLNDILTLAKLESNEVAINSREVDIRNTITSIIATIEPKARDKGIHVSTHINSNVPAQVFVDELKLKQIIINITGNSIKYTNKGCITIFVKRDNKDNLSISIEDTGRGMDRTEITRLFSSYQQQSTCDDIDQGIGLGLSICQRLVHAMNGELSVASTPGFGTLITILLPETTCYSEPSVPQIDTIYADAATQNQLQKQFYLIFIEYYSMHRNKIVSYCNLDEIKQLLSEVLPLTQHPDLHPLHSFLAQLDDDVRHLNIVDITSKIETLEQLYSKIQHDT